MFFKKKTKKDIGNLMVSGAAMGIGSQVLGDVGATHAQTAVGKITKHYPTIGTMVGAGMTMDAFSQLQKKMKKKY